jgi:signal transduction histidine kinase
VDTVLAAVLTALSVVSLLGNARDVGSRSPAAAVLLLLQTIPLVWRRRAPLAVFGVVAGATLGSMALADGPAFRTSLGVLVAIYTVSDALPPRRSAALVAAFGLAFGVVGVIRAGPLLGLQGFAQSLIILGVAWALGQYAQTRQRYTRALEEKAALLEQQRASEAARVVAEERQRIARELHDVVAHGLSVIVLQAGGAQRILERRPDEARTALTAIEGASRQALLDMRRMLGVLGGDDEADRSPSPSLDRLGGLLEQVRAAGLPVELAVSGQPRALDPALELSAYRIVQEALTNALKHARGAHARVQLDYGSADLELRIEDAGGAGGSEPVEAAHPGRGLDGMRQRAATVGGELEAARTATGFLVRARLPFAASALPSAPAT